MTQIQFKAYSLLYGLSHFWWLRQIVFPSLRWPDLSDAKNSYLFRNGERSWSNVLENRNNRKDLGYLLGHYIAKYYFITISLTIVFFHLLSLLLITYTTFQYRALSLTKFIRLKPGTITTNLSLLMPVIYVSFPKIDNLNHDFYN